MAHIAQNSQKELDEQIRLKKIRPIALIDLLFNVIALNVATFLMLPILCSGFQMGNKKLPS